MILFIFSIYKRKGFSASGLGLLLVGTLGSMCVASEQPVQVQVSIKPLKENNALYSYCVTNSEKEAITMLAIGATISKNSDVLDTYEIKSLPVESHRAKGIQKNSRSPEGWEISLMTQEDADEVFIDWSIKNIASRGIAPQTSLCGFEVAASNDDKAYSEGHWTVIFDGNSPPKTGLLNSQAKQP